jgi:hypothetical protein
MANEADDLVLVHLRAIRATLAEHSARFDRIDDRFADMAAYMSERFAQVDGRFTQVDGRFAQVDARFSQVDERFAQMDRRFGQVDQRFAQMDTRFDDLRDVLSHTFAVSTTNNLKSQQHDQLYQFSEGEQQRLTQRVDDIERRLVKVERKLES